MSKRKLIKEFLEDFRTIFKRSDYSAKVFCIGYNKTGTTSCGRAFELLGYRNLSFKYKVWRGYYKNKEIAKMLKIASKYDSFDDLPWLKEDMIPILDKTFPGSKFVYLERDEESWKKSFYNWRFKQFGQYPDIEKGLEDFRKHKEFVFEYFKNRQSDLLTINISDKEAFMKLAKFLKKETTFREMPHENKT